MQISRLFPLVVLLFLLVGAASVGLAQGAGDFRTVQSGEWGDVNTWERYNGSA